MTEKEAFNLSEKEKLNKNEKKKFVIDEIYQEIGQFGNYQGLILVMVCLCSTTAGLAALSTVFADATPEHRCQIPGLANDTFAAVSSEHQELIDFHVPYDEINEKHDECHIKVNNDSLIECSSWVFSKQYYENNIITEWNLVCSNVYEKGIYKTLFFIGYFGVILLGPLSDRFGRKNVSHWVMILNTIAFCLVPVTLYFIKNIIAAKVMFGILRFLVGFCSAVFALGSILLVELVGPKFRVLANNSLYYFYILGEFINLFLVYLVRDHKVYSIYAAVLVSGVIIYYWYVPESPRYLIGQRRYEEANTIFKRIAKSNKKDYDYSPSDLAQEKESQEKTVTFKSYLTNKSIILKLFISFINFFANALAYYGISMNIDVLGGNIFINVLYSVLIEFFGVFMSQFLIDKFGRKIPYVVCLSTCGISLMVIGFVPSHMKGLIIALVLIGKSAVSFSYNVIYIITIESYPTIIRSTALSSCCILEKVGTVLTPYVQLLGGMYWAPLPFIIYGVVAAISALLYLILIPESDYAKLPETFQDACDKPSSINNSKNAL